MRILALILLLLYCPSLFAADVEVCFTLPEAKAQRVINAFNGLRPIPDDNADGQPDLALTPAQWTKEQIRQYIVYKVYQWEQQEAVRNANVQLDDEVAT